MAAVQGKSMRKIVMELINEQLLTHEDEECPYSHAPNKETLKALENVEKGKNLVRAKDAKDLFKRLGI